MTKPTLFLMLVSFGCAASPARPPPRCAPPGAMEVLRVASYCGLHMQEFYWDGRACVAVTDCACGMTRDCAPYYPTLSACRTAHAHCR